MFQRRHDAPGKLLEYSIFDLSNFITPDLPPTVSVSVTNSPTNFTQGDASDTISINVTNTSASIAADATLQLSVVVPASLTPQTMFGPDPGTGWNCTVATLTCTRTAPLNAGASDPVTLTVSVANNATPGAGTLSVAATASGGGLTASVSGSDSFGVIGVPIITWSTPAPIAYGTALSATQLNASTPVSGTFAYIPPATTVLSAGNNQILTANFTSSNPFYTNTSANVTINVIPTTPTITATGNNCVYNAAPCAGSGSATGIGGVSLTPVVLTYAGTGSTVYAATTTPPTEAGTYTVTASIAAAGNYATATSTPVAITIIQAPSTATAMGNSCAYTGSPCAGTGSATGVGGVSLTPVVLTYSGTGYGPTSTPPTLPGTYLLVASFGPTQDYAAASSAPATIVIASAAPAVTAIGNTCTYNGAVCAGSGSATGIGGVSLTPVTLTYSGPGYGPTPTPPVNAGTYTVTASFAATATYQAATSAPAPITINKAGTTVFWTTPAPIVYGTPLSATQLDATAGIAGSFVYNPPANAILPAGSALLDASFSPLNSTDYNNSTGSVMLTISKAPSIAALTATAIQTASGTTASLAVVLTPVVNGAAPTGSVTFYDASTPLTTVALAGGSAALTTGVLPAGTNTFTAVYAGDGNFFGATSNSAGVGSTGSCTASYTGNVNVNINVTTGNVCITGANVQGNVTQTGGNMMVTNSTITGNVNIQNADATFSITSSTIGGNLQIQNLQTGTQTNLVCGVSVHNDVQFQNNQSPVNIGAATGCPANNIGGNLRVTNNTAPISLYGNTVKGNLQVGNNTANVIADNNTVIGNMQVQNDTASTAVFSNTVTQGLQCNGNATITGGGNTSPQKQQQCAAF